MVLGVGEKKRTSAAEAEEPSRVCNGNGVGQGMNDDHCVTAGYRINSSSCFSMDHKKVGGIYQPSQTSVLLPCSALCALNALSSWGVASPKQTRPCVTPIRTVPATVMHGCIRSLRGAIPEPRNSDSA